MRLPDGQGPDVGRALPPASTSASVLPAAVASLPSQPLLLAAWGERWRMQGASAEEVKAKLGKILQGADPPCSEAEVTSLLDDAGFGQPTRFFASLFWGAWLSRRGIKGSASATAQA